MLDKKTLTALIAHAAQARLRAYAPYSGYQVGASVVTNDDRVFGGCNVENASYGLSLCAERTAMAAARAAGATGIKAVVVVTEAEPPGTPCGACRQWMAEFGEDTLEIVTANTRGEYRQFTLKDLLPDAFRLR